MQQPIIALLYGMGAGATGVAAISNLLPVLQGTVDPPRLGLSEIIGGALLVLCVYLFRVSREHDRLGAELKAKTERNERDFQRLDAEARTVDTRITESRHMQNNFTAEKFSGLEERLTERLDKIEEKMDRMNGVPR